MKSPRIHITSPFWSRYQKLIHDTLLPYQWAVISDGRTDIEFGGSWGASDASAAKSHAVENLRIAAGRAEGHFHGMVFQDSDVYKWLETAAYALGAQPDEDLKALCDSVIDLIADAQDDDGYVSTNFQIEFPERKFKRLYESHELYCMGHAIEALVGYHQTTGSGKALAVARGMADCIDANFGPEDGKIHGTDGHPEIELGLARLYEETGEKRYLDLARYLVEVRGADPEFYARQREADGDTPERMLIPGCPMFDMPYYLYDKPVAQIDQALGHAVRVVYLFAGLAHIARDSGDQAMLDHCKRMWKDIVRRKMFVTGGIGSSAFGEAFSRAYDLPDDTPYCETCASVGLVFFAQAMLAADANGEYADIVETELYNGALSGMSLDGTRFFYVNPLEADPVASAGSREEAHVRTRRAEWFPCACCPSNISRLVASVERYIYTTLSDGTILVNQFIGGAADFGDGLSITQTTDYPWEGAVHIHVAKPEGEERRIGVRIPGWAGSGWSLTADGMPVEETTTGYAYVTMSADATALDLDLTLDMTPRALRASNRVKENIGQIAVRRGPVVYCAENADNPGPLWNYTVTPSVLSEAAEHRSDELDDALTLTIPAQRAPEEPDGEPLYHAIDDPAAPAPAPEPTQLTLVPYYAWANRANGQMRVWLNAR